MENNFFENAKFGDKFIDGEGKIYIYHCKKEHKSSDGKIWLYHWLIREPVKYPSSFDENEEYEYAPYDAYVFIDGYGVPENLKYYSIDSIKDGPNSKYLIIGKYE